MVEKILAGIALAVCVVMLLGMAIGPVRRARLLGALARLRHWRRHRADARREAQRAIERARRQVERDGNVYRPRQFDKRPPDDRLH